MKQLLYFILLSTILVILPFSLSAKEIKLDSQPSFRGGKEKLEEYLAEHLISSFKRAQEGKVKVHFKVNKNGKISGVRLEERRGTAIDKKIIEVIKSMPNWKPGIYKDKAVNTHYTLTIDFDKLENLGVTRVAEQMPQFPGGHEKLIAFMKENLQYPEKAKEEAIQGRVVLSFIVNEKGEISYIKILRSIHPLLDEEAIRLIGSMPPWEPGSQRGKPIKIEFTLPVSFRL